MVDFTPADHVTEREPGAWEDCTIASIIETVRLSIPNGRRIPPTITEVNAFRAQMGLPDNHPGTTIEQCVPTAKARYGLRDGEYRLTRDWAVLAPALEDPDKVCVVTGMMGAVPASERLTSFTGAHAVAKHGVRVRCDPLGPKDGVYKGNTWPLSTWKSFTHGLPYWQAMIMEAGGAMAVLSMGGVAVTSNKVAKALRSTNLLDAPGGTRIASAQTGYKYPYLGAISGHRMVVVRTAIPYPDKIARDTGLYIINADVTIEDAPVTAPPPSGTDTGPAVQAKWEAWVTTHPK